MYIVKAIAKMSPTTTPSPKFFSQTEEVFDDAHQFGKNLFYSFVSMFWKLLRNEIVIAKHEMINL